MLPCSLREGPKSVLQLNRAVSWLSPVGVTGFSSRSPPTPPDPVELSWQLVDWVNHCVLWETASQRAACAVAVWLACLLWRSSRVSQRRSRCQ